MIQFNINKKVSVLLAVALGFVSLGNAQQALTLAAAKEYALKNAFQLKNTQMDAQSAKLQTEELIAIGLPQISGSIQYQNFIDRPTSILPGDFFGMPGRGVSLCCDCSRKHCAFNCFSRFIANHFRSHEGVE